MYTGYGFRDFEIGDVDVIQHEGIFHLFHLTLPNHDYIAHAISEDGLRWKRVKNALFISDPDAWDDDMLWTMHITPNPFKPGSWRMFYTGLCMNERGRVQRVGLAHSDDLYHWTKDESGAYPLEISGKYYEASIDEGRHWVSFRDPFCYKDGDTAYLLAAGRVNHGPVIRRGCVALAKEAAPNQFEFCPPLFHPMRYDDVEVPNIVKLQDRYYLIGSIREDVKVHYWWADDFEGPYHNFHDNVLLPQGNYAARLSFAGKRCLVWNFFFKGLTVQGHHMMAPPKELAVAANGQLHLKSFQGFQDQVTEVRETANLTPLEPLFQNPHGSGKTEQLSCQLSCDSGLEGFLLQGEYDDFILSGELTLEDGGKCGLLFRLNEEGDGYYISLDLAKGIAQIRAWRHQTGKGFEKAFHYEQLQAAHYIAQQDPHSFCLLAYEQYIELSIGGYVILTLADDQFSHGRLGFYVESAALRVNHLQLKVCDCSPNKSYPTTLPNY